MCNFLSAIVRRDGEILCDPFLTDSHEDLMAKYNIRDGVCQEGKFVRVEFTPPKDRSQVHDLTRWTLKVDEASTPDWFDHEEMHRRFSALVKDMMISGDKEFLLGGCWILLDGVKIKSVKNSVIKFMYGSSQVGEMHDSSQVGKMWGSSQVGEMYGSSQVRVMYDSSQVGEMHDSSQVGKMWGSSQVGEMYDSSQVGEMHRNSRIVNDLRIKK